MFLNVNFQVQEPYNQGFPLNTNVTLGVGKLFFAESVLDMDCLADESGRRPPVILSQNQFLR